MSRHSLPDSVLASIQSVLGHADHIVPLHEPRFAGKEWTYVRDCLDTGWVSSAGKFVDRLEKDLAEYTGAAYAIAVVNGTAALHACLLLSGVTSGDEVLIPSLTFVATANAVSYCGAVPHIIDNEERTLGIDPVKLAFYLENIAEQRPDGCFNSRTGRRISALVPMHTFGHPVDLDPLIEICSKFRIDLVEDAAESLGSFYKGRHTGTFGRLGALSFNGNKIVTSGGGGAILTNDAALGRLAKHLTTTAKVPHQWEYNHDMIGYNYRMPNINAALGCAQLEQLPSFLQSKRRLAEYYANAFRDVPGVRFIQEEGFSKSNYWLNTILLDEELSDLRDAILARTQSAGIMTRPAWTLMHRLTMFENCPRMDLAVSESLARRVINIPSSVGLV